MASLEHYLDELLSRGQADFSREEALEALGMSSAAFIAAVDRLAKMQRLVSPRRGFLPDTPTIGLGKWGA